MIHVAAFLATLSGRLTIIVAGVAALVALRAADVHHQRAIGATKAVAKIEKANDNATKLGKRAADRSAAPGVHGPVDPTTRND